MAPPLTRRNLIRATSPARVGRFDGFIAKSMGDGVFFPSMLPSAIRQTPDLVWTGANNESGDNRRYRWYDRTLPA